MRKVLRGYAKDKDSNLILIGTMPIPHGKDKSSPRNGGSSSSVRLRSARLKLLPKEHRQEAHRQQKQT